MFNDPYVNPRGTFAHPDWEQDDPRIHKSAGRGTFVGAILGVLLLLGVMVAIFGAQPSDTNSSTATTPPATSTTTPPASTPAN